MKNIKHVIREPLDFRVRLLNDSLFWYYKNIKPVPYFTASARIKMMVHRQVSNGVRFTLNNRNTL
jgi:hypothetical protein